MNQFAVEVTLVDGVKKFVSPTGRLTDHFTYPSREDAERIAATCRASAQFLAVRVREA